MNGLRNNRGFSLVELLVAVAIMAILMSIALPSFFAWRGSAVYKQVSWDIASKLRLAREMTITNNLEHRVEFDIDGRRYRLVRGNLSSGSTVWTELYAWQTVDQAATWATGGACAGTADINIGFVPNGSASGDVICIRDGAATRYTVTVSSTSGRVRID